MKNNLILRIAITGIVFGLIMGWQNDSGYFNFILGTFGIIFITFLRKRESSMSCVFFAGGLGIVLMWISFNIILWLTNN